MSVRRNHSSSNKFIAFESIELCTMMSGSGSGGTVYGPVIMTPTVTRPLKNPANSSGSSDTRLDWNKSGDKSPIFDFKDSYYAANGIDVTKIAGRPNGTGGSVIDDRGTDPTRRNVRVQDGRRVLRRRRQSAVLQRAWFDQRRRVHEQLRRPHRAADRRQIHRIRLPESVGRPGQLEQAAGRRHPTEQRLLFERPAGRLAHEVRELRAKADDVG